MLPEKDNSDFESDFFLQMALFIIRHARKG